MKTRTTTTTHGHVIIVTLVICLLLGIVLLSVMKLTTNEGQLTGRSQSWNGAIPVAEAGIEEAFSHLRYCPTNRASNGWIRVGDLYTKNRTLGRSFYEVTISTNYDPIITSRGGIRAPHQTNYIVRTVRVLATNDPMVSAAIEATDSIKFAGGGVTINSYDSRDPNYSGPDGRYDPIKTRDPRGYNNELGPDEFALSWQCESTRRIARATGRRRGSRPGWFGGELLMAPEWRARD